MRRPVKSRFRFGRQNKQMRRTGTLRCILCRSFLENDMRVGSAHAGGHDSRSPRSRAGPFLQLRVHVKGGGRKIDLGIGSGVVKARRYLSVLEGKNGLDHPGDSRRGVEVPNVGFYRTDRAET